jgi:hypothetical protein
MGDFRRILVIELLGGIGDLLMVLPAVHALGRRHAEAKVTVLTEEPGAALLRTDPWVAEVSTSTDVRGELARVDPDLVVSTSMHSGIPAAVAAHGCRAVTDLWRSPPADRRIPVRYLEILRAEGLIGPTDPTPRVHLTADELAWGREIVGEVKRPVVLVRGSGMAVKRWPYFDDLAEIVPVLELPAMSLRELGACFAAVAAVDGIVVGGDTGPVRLAEAMGARVVGLFGPTTVDRYGYGGGNLQGLPDCPHRRPLAITEQPCWWSARCPLAEDGPACMAAISVRDVLGRLSRGGAGRASVRVVEPSEGDAVSDKPNPIQMQKFLGGMEYPATKEQIVEHAKEKGADEAVLDGLQAIPDREYNGPNAVSQAFS